jgi:hypothetical protein
MSLSSGALKVTIIRSISAFLSILALALRCWSRYIKKTGFKFNDYSVIAATILALGGVGANLGGRMTTSPCRLGCLLVMII